MLTKPGQAPYSASFVSFFRVVREPVLVLSGVPGSFASGILLLLNRNAGSVNSRKHKPSSGTGLVLVVLVIPVLLEKSGYRMTETVNPHPGGTIR